MDPYALRREFPILRRQTYLNTCSLGAFGRGAKRRVDEFYREWTTQGAPAWYETWWSRLEATRRAFATLINARADEVAILPSVSAALSILSTAFEDRDRRTVVTSRLDFPTIPYQWLVKRRARVRFVGERAETKVPMEAYADALDADVSALVTSHVLYTTGFIQDAKGLSSLAKKAGAASVIDAYQSVGQLPVDVRAIGCDALVAGGLKWLLGGPGCALLYVRRSRVAEWKPKVASWFGNEHMFEFDAERFAFRRTAARFELGTPALPAVFATLGGMETVLRAGVPAIRRRQNRLVTDLHERLTDARFELASPEEEAERAGILMVRVQDAADTTRRLAARGIAVDHRHGKVRVSPFFYNNERENETLVSTLAELRRFA